MVFKNLCILVFWTKVASTLEWLMFYSELFSVQVLGLYGSPRRTHYYSCLSFLSATTENSAAIYSVIEASKLLQTRDFQNTVSLYF